MKEILHFSVDGEWLTDFVRGWFWNEHKPYNICKDLIGSCMPTANDDQISDVTNLILEGRKKFVGVNEFKLVDDGKKIRRLSDEITRLAKESKIRKIVTEIAGRGIDFIDPWSVKFNKAEAVRQGVLTAQDCSVFFQYKEFDRVHVKMGEYKTPIAAAETPTQAGLWLFSEPELIYECTHEGDLNLFGSDEFWAEIYEKVKGRVGFEARNQLYLAQMRLANDRLIKGPAKDFDKLNADLGYREPPKKDNSLPCWCGLISPEGDFYPCDFGGHEQLANKILDMNVEEWNLPVRCWRDGTKEWAGDYGDALSEIIERGWVACRYIQRYFITYKDECDLLSKWRPTKEQKTTLWNLIVKHNVKSEVAPEIFY